MAVRRSVRGWVVLLDKPAVVPGMGTTNGGVRVAHHGRYEGWQWRSLTLVRCARVFIPTPVPLGRGGAGMSHDTDSL